MLSIERTSSPGHATTTACKLCGSATKLENEKHELTRCMDCGLIFCATTFSEEELKATYARLYNESSEYSAYIESSDSLINGKQPRLGYNVREVIALLDSKSCKSYLEIGAGVGLVGQYLSARGVQYAGIEFDSKTASRAASLGLEVSHGSFLSMADIDETFDAVIAFEVIEHLQELDSFFKLSAARLKDGGYLGFTVPNYSKIENYPPGPRLRQPPPPIHVNFFTLQSIAKILDTYGFDTVLLRTRKYPYMNWRQRATYIFILKALFGMFRGPTLICVARKRRED